MNCNSAQTGLQRAVTSPTYDAANELTNWNGTAISYDLNGNMLSDGSNLFTWNARNQVATLNSVSLQYDGFGRRTNNSAGISFLYNGLNVTQELVNGNVIANILTGGTDQIFQRTDMNGTVVPLTDALGSVLTLVDTSGYQTSQYLYDAFGNTTSSGAPSNNRSLYTGREIEGNGLYYYRMRYYSPSFGRFVSEDPIGFAGGINQYAYTGNDPVNFKDTLGTDKNRDNPGTYWGAFKFIHHCAAERANTLSIASLTGTEDTLYGKLLLGNDASSLSTIIAGPATPDAPGTAPIGSQTGWSALGMVASNPASKDLVNIGLNAAGTIPNIFGPTKFVVGVNGAGTAYAIDAFKPGIGTSGLGKLALGGLGELSSGNYLSVTIRQDLSFCSNALHRLTRAIRAPRVWLYVRVWHQPVSSAARSSNEYA